MADTTDRISHQDTTMETKHHQHNGAPQPAYPDSAVAVIGMACKFSGADSLDQFWDILESGESRCRDLPTDRFPDWRFERRQYPNKFKANVIDDVDTFDHKFFKVASREAMYMDPQQRLALQLTYQALESAGHFTRNPEEREQDMGCYVATCMNEYHENVACHPPTAFSLTGSIRPFIAGKISHYFGWTGPAVIFDTACAASGTAIHTACRAVASGDCKTAVAGATNIFVSPDTFQNLAAGHFINTTGESKSFDAAADGYCRGEGVAFVVLKRLSDALRDGDPIRGVINATAIGQNANETNITVPHGPSQMNLYRKALRMSGLSAQDISYVEAHGTGTPVGDPIEAGSIRGVFGTPNQLDDNKKTYLGSLKSNIGHTEASSGISGLIKVLLMMQKETIPQQAIFNTLNPAIAPFELDNMEIPIRNTPWTREFKAACVNNYGASGANAVMIVTQPPRMQAMSDNTPVTTYPISISAFSPTSLSAYCSALLEFINTFKQRDATGDICYHLSHRRNIDLPYTVSAKVSSAQELKDILTSTLSRQPPSTEKKQSPVVLFFTGQTGKPASVPRALYDSSAVFRYHLDDCDTTLRALGAPSIFPAIFDPEPRDSVVLNHSTLFSRQYASAMAWLDCGLKPSRLIGHSFGQYTALCVSGILSLEDSLRLIVGRARLIEELWGSDSGSMIAIETELNKVSELLAQHTNLGLEIACFNGPQSFVLAGTSPSVDALEASMKSSGKQFRRKRLQIENAFHSALTEPLLRPLRDIAEQLTFHSAKIPIETCSENSSWKEPTPALLASHTREPVYFHEAVERVAKDLGSCVWLEVGSGFGASMLQRALGTQAPIHSVKSFDVTATSSLEPLAEITAELWDLGLEVQYWPFHKSQQHDYRMLNLPPYQFDKSRHWLEWKCLGSPAVVVKEEVPERTSLLQLLRKTQDDGEYQVNTQSEHWRIACTENKTLGVSTCPMSLLLDSVSKAIDEVQGTTTGNTAICTIQDLVLQNTIPANCEDELHLKVARMGKTQSWTFSISSAIESSHIYSSGTVSQNTEGSEKDFARYQRLMDTSRIKSISNDIEADSVKGKAVYKSLAEFYQLPKSSQKVKEVSAKDGEVIGQLVPLSDGVHSAIENFIQVPLISLNSLQDDQTDKMYITTGVGDIMLRGSLESFSNSTTSWSIYVKFFDVKSHKKSCDIFVFDTLAERLSMVILDVSFGAIQVESFRPEIVTLAATPEPSPSRYPDSLVNFEAAEPCVLPMQSLNRSLDDHISNTKPSKPSDLPDLTKAVFELLVNVADVDRNALREDVMIADLGIDSLMGMEVTEEINKFFSIKTKVAEVAFATDVGALCRLIASKTSNYVYKPDRGSRTPSVVFDMGDSGNDMKISNTPDTEFSSTENEYEKVSRSSSSMSLSESSSTMILKAFDAVRNDFDKFAKQTGCDKFWSQVYPHQKKLIVAYIVEAFANLGCDLNAIKTKEQIPEVSHLPKHTKLINRFMQILCEGGLIKKVEHAWFRTSTPVSTQPSSEKYEQILSDFPQFALEHQLLNAIGSNLDECLKGTADPLALLFGTAEKRKLMADQYLNAPIQRSVSQQLCSFIKQYFGSRNMTEVRVLEIGGGTCGTTLPAVDALSKLGIPVEYTFTDISPAFVAAAKAKLSQHKFVKYKTLDITAETNDDMKNYYDMIIATNVIHATPDVCKSASNAREMLRAGGFLTLVEYTQDLYLLDMIFGQLDGWAAYNDGRSHAIMNTDQWKTVLTRAGFRKVDWTGGQTRESEILRIILAY